MKRYVNCDNEIKFVLMNKIFFNLTSHLHEQGVTFDTPTAAYSHYITQKTCTSTNTQEHTSPADGTVATLMRGHFHTTFRVAAPKGFHCILNSSIILLSTVQVIHFARLVNDANFQVYKSSKHTAPTCIHIRQVEGLV